MKSNENLPIHMAIRSAIPDSFLPDDLLSHNPNLQPQSVNRKGTTTMTGAWIDDPDSDT